MIDYYKLVLIILSVILLNPYFTLSGKNISFVQKDFNKLDFSIPYYDINNNPNYFNKNDENILLVFWATWQPDSIRILYDLNYLQKDFQEKGLKIIALSEDYKKIEEVKDFLKNNNITHIAPLSDYKNKIYFSLGELSLPSFFLIQPRNNKLLNIIGYPKWHNNDIRKILLQYMRKNIDLPRNTFIKRDIFKNSNKHQLS